MTVLFFSDGRFQRNRLLRNLQNFPYPFFRHIHFLCNFLRSRFSPQLLQELSAHPNQLIDRLHHMHGDTNRSGLIGNGSCDRLSNPPGSISREFISFTIIKFFHCLNQAHISFLNQIEKEHATSHVSLCNTHYKTQIRFCQPLFRLCISHFHLLCQINFLFRIQKRHLTNLLQIHPDRVLDADSVRDREVDIFHIYLVFFCQNDFLFAHIIAFGNAQYIHMVLFQCLYDLIELFLFQIQLCKKISDFLIFQNILFLFGNI